VKILDAVELAARRQSSPLGGEVARSAGGAVEQA
jgi:hypothetical protein